MQFTLLKAKLHGAIVTAAELDYEGSCAIDGELLERAGILEYEQVHLYNLTNGERLVTYAIGAPAGSGEICAYGAAAHRMRIGDRIIIAAYAGIDAASAAKFKPCILVLGEGNRIKAERGSVRAA